MQTVISEKELNAALERLKELPLHLQDNIKPILQSAARPMLATAKRLAPMQTGHISDGKWEQHKPGTLKRSLAFIPTPSKRAVFIGAKVRGGKATGDYEDGFYAMWIEYGHKTRSGTNVDAQPFMRPAYEQHKSEVIAGIRDAVSKKIARWAKRSAK